MQNEGDSNSLYYTVVNEWIPVFQALKDVTSTVQERGFSSKNLVIKAIKEHLFVASSISSFLKHKF